MTAPATDKDPSKDQMDAPAKRTEQPTSSLPHGGGGGVASSASDSNMAFPSDAPGEDETALWLGEGGGGGGSDGAGLMAPLEPGGALMSAGGGWSFSTLPGDEGLRWSSVKTEQVFDEWAASGRGKHQAAMMQPSLLLTSAAAGGDSGSAKGGGSLAKSDTEEGWRNFMGPAPTPPCSNATTPHGGETDISRNFPPSSLQHQLATTVATKGMAEVRPTANHSASSSTKDNIAAFAKQGSTPAAARAPAAESTTTTPPAPPHDSRAASKAPAPAPPPRAAATQRAEAAPAPRDASSPAASASASATAGTRRTRKATAVAAAAAAAAAADKLAEAEQPADEDDDDNDDEDDDDDDDDYVEGPGAGAGAGGRSSSRAAAAKPKRATTTMGDKRYDEDDLDADDDDDDPAGTELTDKRRRNREHAKRSRLRKRVRLGGLEELVLGLRRENVRLRQMVMRGIPDRAGAIIRNCAKDNTNADVVAKQDVIQGMRPGMSVGSSSSSWTARGGTRTRPKPAGGGGGNGKGRHVPSALKLMSPCYQTVKSLADSQANFVLTNPNLPDCPIIFASQGFLDLTGYDGNDVIGKNCRFLQGRGTDPVTLSIIRNNVAAGLDTSVCILNYKKDKTPFWNQLSIGVLLDSHGQVANHVGVMCEVNQMPPAVFHRLLHRVPLPESLLHDDSDSDNDGHDDHRVSRAEVAAGSSGQSSSTGGGAGRGRSSSISGDVADKAAAAAASSRIVDRLHRTRAAAAICNKNSGPAASS